MCQVKFSAMHLMEPEPKFQKKTEINSKQVKIYFPYDYVYHSLLGEGAFGKIRKCLQKKKLFEILPVDLIARKDNMDWM
jgi:hypothetical protein